jgi:hypothetical protein
MHADIKKYLFRYSELSFWSHAGLNLAHGKIATFPDTMHMLTQRPEGPREF